MDIEKIAVFGSGLMGMGIAHVIARCNKKVLVFSTSTDAKTRFLSYLQNEQCKKRIGSDEFDGVSANVSFYSWQELEQLSQVQLVIESTYEDQQYKLALLSKIIPHCLEECLIASNTSTLSISLLGREVVRPERFIGLHFVSPVAAMKLVEVIKGSESSLASIEAAKAFCETIKMVPVLVADSPGFILNRILTAYLSEPGLALMDNQVTVAEVDGLISQAIGTKIGPLRLVDYIGVDIIKKSMDIMYQALADQDIYSDLIQRLDALNCLGKKTKRGFYQYD